MTVTPLKIKFGKLLRDYLHRSGVRQNKLAEELKISGSAISQMLSGRIVLNQPQLKQICELLSLDEMQSYELISMLSSIRNGVENLTSPFNKQLFALRCQRGLTVRQLSNLSGVPVSHIEVMESCFDAVPAVDEVEKLARVLDFPLTSLLRSAGLNVGTSEKTDSAVETMASETALSPYRSGAAEVPVVRLSELDEYDGSENWYDFVRRISCHSESPAAKFAGIDGVAILLAPASELGLGLSGEARVTLVVKPHSGFKEIKLCCDINKRFFFAEKIGRDSMRVLRIVGTRRPSDKVKWAIPMLELVLCPMTCKAKGK